VGRREARADTAEHAPNLEMAQVLAMTEISMPTEAEKRARL